MVAIFAHGTFRKDRETLKLADVSQTPRTVREFALRSSRHTPPLGHATPFFRTLNHRCDQYRMSKTVFTVCLSQYRSQLKSTPRSTKLEDDARSEDPVSEKSHTVNAQKIKLGVDFRSNWEFHSSFANSVIYPNQLRPTF